MDNYFKSEQLFQHIILRAHAYEKKRKNELKKIKTKEDVKRRQNYIKEKLATIIDKFPKRTPLKAEVVDKIEREQYFIEKIIYQSRPFFHVTANLYLPKNMEFPVPGILSPCGHSYNGKADMRYCKMYVGLVKKGYAVLSYDPVSQGERLQYLNSNSHLPEVGYGVNEHCIIGNLLYLLGENLATYLIWDGIRGLDYLCEREEVDESMIGCTGNSGGGTLTTYIAALDNRVKVAVPSCYITSLYKRIATRVTADPEQNFVNILKYGIDHSDLLLLFAPKPLQINAAIKDYFPIEGTRQTFAELKQFYKILGAEERINMFENDAGHGLTKNLRESVYSWMNKWFKGQTSGYKEPSVTVESECNLLCTKTGHVLSSFSEETTIFPKDKTWVQETLPSFRLPRDTNEYVTYKSRMLEKVRKITCLSHVDFDLTYDSKIIKKVSMDDYDLEKIVFKSESDIWIPAFLFHPRSFKKDVAAIYVHEEGKDLGLRANDYIQHLIKCGLSVLAIDPRGMGESKSRISSEIGYQSLYGIEADLTYSSFMIGEPLFGMRVLDIIRSIGFLDSREDFKKNKYLCIGDKNAALLCLFAAALDSRISSVALWRMLVNYKSLVMNKHYEYPISYFLPGLLKNIDLSDIASIIAPRKLILCNTINQQHKEISLEELRHEYHNVIEIYKLFEAEDAFVISSPQNDSERAKLYESILLGSMNGESS